MSVNISYKDDVYDFNDVELENCPFVVVSQI